MSRLDHDMRLHRAGYLTAAMGRRLPKQQWLPRTSVSVKTPAPAWSRA